MRKISIILILLALAGSANYAQYKDIPYDTKVKLQNNSLILGFINPKNFSLTHSFNLSYATFGSGSYSIASYTGTLSYKVLKNMNVSADITMQYSPFASISGNTSAMNSDLQKSLSGVYLSRLSLNYSPAKNMFINIEYVNNKNYNWFNNYYNDFYFSRFGGY